MPDGPAGRRGGCFPWDGSEEAQYRLTVSLLNTQWSFHLPFVSL